MWCDTHCTDSLILLFLEWRLLKPPSCRDSKKRPNREGKAVLAEDFVLRSIEQAVKHAGLREFTAVY